MFHHRLHATIHRLRSIDVSSFLLLSATPEVLLSFLHQPFCSYRLCPTTAKSIFIVSSLLFRISSCAAALFCLFLFYLECFVSFVTCSVLSGALAWSHASFTPPLEVAAASCYWGFPEPLSTNTRVLQCLVTPSATSFFCSSNFFRLSITSSTYMSITHSSSLSLSLLDGRFCPPWAPDSPFFYKASILTRSSLFTASILGRLSVFLSAWCPRARKPFSSPCGVRLQALPTQPCWMSFYQRLQRHLVHTFDSEQNLHIHCFLTSIEITLVNTFSARSFTGIHEPLVQNLETIANRPDTPVESQVRTTPTADCPRNRDTSTHTNRHQEHKKFVSVGTMQFARQDWWAELAAQATTNATSSGLFRDSWKPSSWHTQSTAMDAFGQHVSVYHTSDWDDFDADTSGVTPWDVVPDPSGCTLPLTNSTDPSGQMGTRLTDLSGAQHRGVSPIRQLTTTNHGRTVTSEGGKPDTPSERGTLIEEFVLIRRTVTNTVLVVRLFRETVTTEIPTQGEALLSHTFPPGRWDRCHVVELERLPWFLSHGWASAQPQVDAYEASPLKVDLLSLQKTHGCDGDWLLFELFVLRVMLEALRFCLKTTHRVGGLSEPRYNEAYHCQKRFWLLTSSLTWLT